jgi:hypothetical protein
MATLALLALAALAACGPSATGTAVAVPAGLPIDPAIEPVSGSHPSPEAAAALAACGFANFDPQHSGAGGLDIHRVAGMGKVTPGRNVTKYAPLAGTPEIATDEPLWVIVTDDAWITLGWDADGHRGATCTVPDGDWGQSIWFVTGDSRKTDGTIETPRTAPGVRPTWRLPPLAP